MNASRYYAAISPWTVLATVVSWSLTVALVFNLLGGPFEARSCQTGCMQSLGLASFIVAVAGVLLGHRPPHHLVTLLCLLSMLGLILIYLTTFFIGVLFG